MTSTEQVSRLLAMVPYLRARPGIAITEAAEQFGITPAQMMKDLRVLWMCGLPGGLPDDLIEVDMDAAEGEGVIHLSNADYLVRPVRFTRDEAVSLLVALNAIAEMAPGELGQASRSAAAKLSSITGQGEPVWLGLTSGDAALRRHLLDAVAGQRRIRLTYDGAIRGETTRPVVDPAGIEMRDSVAYLHAWSLDRDAWRLFRLDRIVEVTDTGEPGADHGPVPVLSAGWFDGSDGQVVLDLGPAVAWAVDYFPVRDVQPGADGHTRVTLAVADPGWLQALLLRLGADATVVEPAQAGETAAQAAREAIELTERICGSLPGTRQ